MKINELVGAKKHLAQVNQEPTDDEVEQGLELDYSAMYSELLMDHGFHEIGSGSFASIWAHPKLSYVLKVFSTQDIAYMAWAKTAAQYKNNPHMPKFVSLKPIKLTKEHYALRMEKLKPSGWHTESICREMRKLVDIYETQVMAGDITHNRDSFNYLLQHTTFDTIREYAKQYPQFIDALWVVVQMTQDKYYEDLWPKNIMFRGADCLVFTDPIV